MRRRIVLWPALGGMLLAAALLWRANWGGDAADRPHAAVPSADEGEPATVAPLTTVFARTPTAAAVAESALAKAACRIVERGSVPAAGAFGHPFASHIHVSYWQSGAEAERDVLLAGGLWRPEEGVSGGRYRLYAGCTDAQVRRKILIYQRQANREEPGINAGWGDPRAFDWVAADV